MYWMYFLLGGCSLLVASWVLYKRYKRSLRNKLFQIAIDFFLGQGFADLTRWSVPSAPQEATIRNRTLCIPYTFRGQSYEVYLPFSRSLKPRMLNARVFLVGEEGSETEIHPQPGIQLFVTANMLRVHRIKVLYLDTDKEEYFEGDRFPDFSSA
jgi:hypothetical protein